MRPARLTWGFFALTFAVGAGLVFARGLPLPPGLAFAIHGGQKLTLKLQAAGGGDSEELRARTLRVLERRFAGASSRPAGLRFFGEDQIEVLAPGLPEAVSAEELLAEGRLGIRLAVDEGSLSAAKLRAEIQRLVDARREGQALPEGPYELAYAPDPRERERASLGLSSLGRKAPLLLEKGDVGSEDVASASLVEDQAGARAVRFAMTESGAVRLRALTSDAVGRQIVVLMDGRVLQIATLRAPLGREGVLQGLFKEAEGRVIAGLMNGGGLDAKLELTGQEAAPPSAAAAWMPWIEAGLPWTLAALALFCVVLAGLSGKREPADPGLVS